jgi:N-acetylglucosaminyl-diphospho-decaprenol L-rhamnosyltransferase
MPIRISTIIVTYNSSYIIADCLHSLMNAIPVEGSEIIVVDNASSDKTLEIVKGFKGHVKTISSEENVGFAGGVNRGIFISGGEYILLINPDLMINSKCLEGMMDFLESYEKVGAAGVKLVYPDGRRQPSRRRYPVLRGVLANRIGMMKNIFGTEILDHYLMEDASNTEPEEVEWLIGACMMFRRKALQEVGLFDEDFFLYFEDADWCYRAQRKGWKVFYLPQFEAIHLYQRESTQGANKQLYWHIKSLARLYKKHGFRF